MLSNLQLKSPVQREKLTTMMGYEYKRRGSIIAKIVIFILVPEVS